VRGQNSVARVGNFEPGSLSVKPKEFAKAIHQVLSDSCVAVPTAKYTFGQPVDPFGKRTFRKEKKKQKNKAPVFTRLAAKKAAHLLDCTRAQQKRSSSELS
jgi:hypothetical protein